MSAAPPNDTAKIEALLAKYNKLHKQINTYRLGTKDDYIAITPLTELLDARMALEKASMEFLDTNKQADEYNNKNYDLLEKVGLALAKAPIKESKKLLRRELVIDEETGKQKAVSGPRFPGTRFEKHFADNPSKYADLRRAVANELINDGFGSAENKGTADSGKIFLETVTEASREAKEHSDAAAALLSSAHTTPGAAVSSSSASPTSSRPSPPRAKTAGSALEASDTDDEETETSELEDTSILERDDDSAYDENSDPEEHKEGRERATGAKAAELDDDSETPYHSENDEDDETSGYDENSDHEEHKLARERGTGVNESDAETSLSRRYSTMSRDYERSVRTWGPDSTAAASPTLNIVPSRPDPARVKTTSLVATASVSAPTRAVAIQDANFEKFCHSVVTHYQLEIRANAHIQPQGNKMLITDPKPEWEIRQIPGGDREITIPDNLAAAEKIIRSAIKAAASVNPPSPITIDLKDPNQIAIAIDEGAKHPNLIVDLSVDSKKIQNVEIAKAMQPTDPTGPHPPSRPRRD